jgi:hypothetical protein
MTTETSRSGKYYVENLVPALRLFISARNRAIEMGFTDNGGAIHSVERILDILGQRICYPHLTHINDLKTDQNAEISDEANIAREGGESVFIEHVFPQRAFARLVIDFVGHGCSDEEIFEFIKARYRLVLLSKKETDHINRINRSNWAIDRIADAGIILLRKT